MQSGSASTAGKSTSPNYCPEIEKYNIGSNEVLSKKCNQVAKLASSISVGYLKNSRLLPQTHTQGQGALTFYHLHKVKVPLLVVFCLTLALPLQN